MTTPKQKSKLCVPLRANNRVDMVAKRTVYYMQMTLKFMKLFQISAILVYANCAVLRI